MSQKIFFLKNCSQASRLVGFNEDLDLCGKTQQNVMAQGSCFWTRELATREVYKAGAVFICYEWHIISGGEHQITLVIVISHDGSVLFMLPYSSIFLSYRLRPPLL